MPRVMEKSENKRKIPIWPLCEKVLSGCIVVGNYHPECWEIKKEKENNPFLFAKVERLEKEIRKMKGARK